MYPPDVQKTIDMLKDRYAENPSLEAFNVLHLYPGKLAYPSGYYEARYFRLVGFNYEVHQRRDLGEHDGLRFHPAVVLRVSEIYADGSFVLGFEHPVKVALWQAAEVSPA